MDDFPGLMADFGFRQQGKAAPMAPSKSASIGSRSANPLSFEDIFNSSTNSKSSSASSMPVYDKPVYDDDIFEGVPGIRSTSSNNKVEYEDVFGSNLSKGGGNIEGSGGFDDLLGGLGSSSSRVESKKFEDFGGFEELIPGFGGSSPPNRREPSEASQPKSSKSSEVTPNDPFAVFEMASAPTYSSARMGTDPVENHSSSMNSDPFENLGKPTNLRKTNVDTSPISSGMFDNINAFDGFSSKSVPSYTTEDMTRKEKSSPNYGINGASEKSSADAFDTMPEKRSSVKSFDSVNNIQSPKSEGSPYERNARSGQYQSPRSYDHSETADDIWLTVSEIPLFTQPSTAPPPSRPPPSLVNRSVDIGRDDVRRRKNESYSHTQDSVRKHGASPIDDLEDFALGRSQSNENADVLSEDSFKTNSAAEASAAAMKEAMDRAEAKFKHAKEVRERERDARSSKGGEDGVTMSNTDDNGEGERQEQLERERLRREMEEREERRRVEKEKQLERERNRQAVERATREARQRAAAEAIAKQERVAVDKANAEARLRAERAAVQRAANEARERAAAEARERAAAEARERAASEAREKAAANEAREKAAREKAASEARDRERAAVNRAAAEARARAGRAAVDRVHAEARERAAAEARDKAAASVNREKHNKTENDLDSFFGMGSRANSTPKQRATTSDNFFETQTQGTGSADMSRRASSTSSSTIRKASSTTNIVDDLTSIFGGGSSSGNFQEVEGETEERRRARLERHQRTSERAAKALAEKNERDMQAQREQAERNRFAETLDTEIKRWAAGKEGNLRALLSTLQYVLWPECGWQPVSLTDLITGAHVKKVYRKATLCIHPDKVQQKGATLQQKYIAEKVFDLLKEAWNKFNSEELF